MIVLDNKSNMCMSNNGKDTKHTSQISRRIHFVRFEEKCKMQNIDWCERGLQWADISTNNFGKPDLTPGMKYIMVILDN